METERGDIDLKLGKAPVPKIDARSRSGNIELELPESAKFELKATTEPGRCAERVRLTAGVCDRRPGRDAEG